MGIPHLTPSRRHSQEQKYRCKLAISKLAILSSQLTLFCVPLHLRPQLIDDGNNPRALQMLLAGKGITIKIAYWIAKSDTHAGFCH